MIIDIENEIFAHIAKELRFQYPSISVYGEPVYTAATFPCVTIVETDNHVVEETKTGRVIENHARVVYEINVYTNKQVGKKKQCKEIMKLIDDQLNELGFVRILAMPVLNLEDASIYRMVARYRTIVSAGRIIHRGGR